MGCTGLRRVLERRDCQAPRRLLFQHFGTCAMRPLKVQIEYRLISWQYPISMKYCLLVSIILSITLTIPFLRGTTKQEYGSSWLVPDPTYGCCCGDSRCFYCVFRTQYYRHCIENDGTSQDENVLHRGLAHVYRIRRCSPLKLRCKTS